MSAIVTGRVLWTSFPDISYKEKNGKMVNIKEQTAKGVMVAIADSADDFGENSYQSFETIAIKASIERRSAIRAVRGLILHGYLKVAGISPFGTNNFSVILDKLAYPPAKRARIGRPKIGDSEAKIGDSEAKIGDSTSPDPSLSIHKPSRVAGLSDEEKTTILFKGDFREYPEHLWEIAKSLQTDWGFALPERPRKNHAKTEFAKFCAAMEGLYLEAGNDAPALLKEVRAEFVAYMKTHGGLAPFTVATPEALKKSLASKAREARAQAQQPAQADPKLPPLFRASEADKTTPPPPEVVEWARRKFGK
jgi:hypothetical protein